MNIPLRPTGGVLLPAEPPEREAALAAALEATDAAGRKAAIGAVAARWPDCLAAWAALGDVAWAAGDDVEAYAYYRVAYHRSLDRLRQNGWRGAGRVPYSHPPNQPFHLAVLGLARTSAAFGDTAEAERCRQLLLDADPSDPLGIAGADLTARP
jgi:tetratricopeptide (TPR) repeat protein